MQSNDKKIALVTGANKGLGFEISRQLAKQGIISCPHNRLRYKAGVQI